MEPVYGGDFQFADDESPRRHPIFSLRLGQLAALWGIGLWLCTGCSSLIYFPSSQNFTQLIPAEYRLHLHSVRIDGEQLDLWEAKARKRSKNGCLLLVHGNGQNASAHIQSVLWMTEEGYRVFSFDYRGYGNSTGSPDPENTVSDTIAILGEVQKRCSGQPIAALGQSLGGAVLLRSLIEMEHPPVYAAMIDSSFLSYRSVAVDILSRQVITWPFQWLGWLVLSDRWAPISAVEKLKPLPILVMHGTDDPLIPFHFGEELFRAIEGPDRTFLTIPGGRHTEAFFVGRGRYRRNILEWLSSYQQKKRN